MNYMITCCCIGQGDGEATRLCIFAKFRDSRGERTSSMTLLRQLLVMIMILILMMMMMMLKKLLVMIMTALENGTQLFKVISNSLRVILY